MNSKQRVVISLISLSIVLILGIVFVISWFATLKYAYFTNLDGQFKANRVQGTVQATAIYAGYPYRMTKDGETGGQETIVFNGSEEASVQRLYVPYSKIFSLTTRFNYLVLEYVFTNTSPSDEWLINLTSTFDGDNIVVTSAYFEDEGITDYSLIDNPYDNEYIKSLPVATNGKVFVYIKIAVADVETNAEFSANFAWTLNSRNYVNGL